MDRMLLVLRRIVGFAAAFLSAVLAVGLGYHMLRSNPNPLNLAQSDASQVLVADALRLAGAIWVMRSALKGDAARLLRALLIVGVGSFVFLFSFYIMIMSVAGDFISFRNIPYLQAICELLYIAARVLVVYALLWAGIGGRTNDDDDP